MNDRRLEGRAFALLDVVLPLDMGGHEMREVLVEAVPFEPVAPPKEVEAHLVQLQAGIGMAVRAGHVVATRHHGDGASSRTEEKEARDREEEGFEQEGNPASPRFHMEASNLLADQAGFEVCRRFVVARNPARTDHASSSV